MRSPVSDAAPAPAPEAKAQARAYAGFGVLAFWGVVLGLTLGADYAMVDALLLAALLAAVPGLSMAQVPLIKGMTVDRLPAYWSSILTLWLLGTGCWLVGTRGDGASAIGIVLLPVGAMVGWSVGLTAAGMGIILLFRWVGSRVGVAETLLLRSLLPRTTEERRVFAVLSVAAGTGEELAYRGYAIPMLAPLLGIGGAAALSTLVFGLMHGYQGRLGIVRTTLMGAVLAGGFILSGSLIPAMIAHTAIDLMAGIAIGDWLLSPEPDYGVNDSVSSPS
jgi:membrane protease YdiL (CAAX protease family)